MRRLDGVTDSMDKNLGKLWEMVRDREARCARCATWDCKELDVTWVLNNKSTTNTVLSAWYLQDTKGNQEQEGVIK